MLLGLALLALTSALVSQPRDSIRDGITLKNNGELHYPTDQKGNRLVDFSHAGFRAGLPLPIASTAVAIPPAKEDSTDRIQAAINSVATLSEDAQGVRGAVLLLNGTHQVAGQLRLASGVILRGQGKETRLLGTGQGRRALIRIAGSSEPKVEVTERSITEDFVPAGAVRFQLSSTEGLRTGDRVFIRHPSTKEWITTLGMDKFPSRDKGSYLDWKPGTLDLLWDRTITKVEGNFLTLDTPITCSIEKNHGGGKVKKYSWPSRLQVAGVENLHCESEYNRTHPLDEDHCWDAVSIENAEDVWVRAVTFTHFAGSAVAVWESGRRVTVADCESREPVSELGGSRRHTFFTSGQQTLFLRCQAKHGRHDFSTGHLAAGPNAFVHCRAQDAHEYSGPIGSWACGVLFDNCQIDGRGLALTNRETDGQGTGWAAANSVLWQCTAPEIICRKPPGQHNWALGVWGHFKGDGHWRQMNEFITPRSLYEAQLSSRLGNNAVQSLLPVTFPTDSGNAPSQAQGPAKKEIAKAKKLLTLEQGELRIAGKSVGGKRLGTVWWRGSVLPSRANEIGVGITRFVPGREGDGFTDSLAQLTDWMNQEGYGVLDHHWGLWYDRRRDDHQMVRRMNGDVWAPFYEQPWSRSGKGKAWDGLSKYDLTHFNPWYFSRLREFARQCEEKGLVLRVQMYFQHNILEAGAHWADFPWRPANCLQDTGFPEPPNYNGGKRIFMADDFYDLSHPVRKDLHQKYIRHCLDVLGDCPNVIFQTGEEFTGPLNFMRFWLDTIEEWQVEKKKKVLVGLSCTKDVQDAILADQRRAAILSIIDLKYWWYTAGGGLFSPEGGKSLAPRQQLREWKGDKSRSAASLARAAKEYQQRFPQKAITVSVDGASAWAFPRLQNNTAK